MILWKETVDGSGGDVRRSVDDSSGGSERRGGRDTRERVVLERHGRGGGGGEG
jgi:hypothetical protein